MLSLQNAGVFHNTELISLSDNTGIEIEYFIDLLYHWL